MDKLIVTISGILSLGGIYWFFFGKKEEAVDASDAWTITVEGGYKPNTIKIPKDKAATLTLIRKDQNSCLEEIVFPDYKIKEYLPLNKEVTITLPPPHKPSGFHCGMNMFHGKIVVV
ncbi:cupredoxin domain-containing protein [Candidatus Gottesmanbacteria bacterium]|nr:cupredoxin domain-containing protein [Candidatus Gottesmanbacteria bacterium]